MAHTFMYSVFIPNLLNNLPLMYLVFLSYTDLFWPNILVIGWRVIPIGCQGAGDSCRDNHKFQQQCSGILGSTKNTGIFRDVWDLLFFCCYWHPSCIDHLLGGS